MPETDVIKRKLFLSGILHCFLTNVSGMLGDELAIKDCFIVVKTRKWQYQL